MKKSFDKIILKNKNRIFRSIKKQLF